MVWTVERSLSTLTERLRCLSGTQSSPVTISSSTKTVLAPSFWSVLSFHRSVKWKEEEHLGFNEYVPMITTKVRLTQYNTKGVVELTYPNTCHLSTVLGKVWLGFGRNGNFFNYHNWTRRNRTYKFSYRDWREVGWSPYWSSVTDRGLNTPSRLNIIHLFVLSVLLQITQTKPLRFRVHRSLKFHFV